MRRADTAISTVEVGTRQAWGVPSGPIFLEQRLKMRSVINATTRDKSESEACGRAHCDSQSILLPVRRKAVVEAVRDQSLFAVSRAASLISSKVCVRRHVKLV